MANLPGISASAAALSRNFGLWQDRAMAEPVLVTHHGRPRAVLVSAEDYARLGAVQARAEPEEDGGDAIVLDRIAQCLVVLDAEFAVLRVNRAAAAYFRRSAASLVGMRLGALYPALHESTHSRIFARVMRSGEAVSFEAPSSMYPGQQLRIDAFPLGEGIAYLFQPVSDAELRHRIAESEALKALFAAHGGAGTMRLTARGTFSAIDPPIAALTGFAEADLIGARLIDLVPLPRRAELRDALEKVLDGGGAAAFPIEIMTRDGREIAVTMALSELREGFAIEGAAVLVTLRGAED